MVSYRAICRYSTSSYFSDTDLGTGPAVITLILTRVEIVVAVSEVVHYDISPTDNISGHL